MFFNVLSSYRLNAQLTAYEVPVIGNATKLFPVRLFHGVSAIANRSVMGNFGATDSLSSVIWAQPEAIYNPKRLQSALNYLSSVEIEKQFA